MPLPPSTPAILAILAIVAAQVAALRRMGRAWGQARLWAGANEANTSQRVLDAYSATHVTHGVLLYWATRAVPLSAATKLALATAVEVAWEVSENTPAVIAKYRRDTISLGYDGDSVVNSVSDVACMAAGFAAAAALPWHASVAWVAITELVLLLTIRDNLTLNVLQLVAPSETVKAWQARGTKGEETPRLTT